MYYIIFFSVKMIPRIDWGVMIIIGICQKFSF